MNDVGWDKINNFNLNRSCEWRNDRIQYGKQWLFTEQCSCSVWVDVEGWFPNESHPNNSLIFFVRITLLFHTQFSLRILHLQSSSLESFFVHTYDSIHTCTSICSQTHRILHSHFSSHAQIFAHTFLALTLNSYSQCSSLNSCKIVPFHRSSTASTILLRHSS